MSGEGQGARSDSYEPSQFVQRIRSSLRSSVRLPPGAVSLAVGDPDMPTPKHIVEALAEAVGAGYTHYVDKNGDPELREAIAESLSRRVRRTIGPTEVLITQGGTAAIASVMLANLDPGDRVLIPEPNYSLYADVARLAGATPVFVRQNALFHLDLDALEAEAPTAKMVIICNPCNPTGVVYEGEELHRLADLVRRHNLWFLSDEAYHQIVFDNRPFVSALELEGVEHRLLYCQTFSKTYAMTGWRLGYISAPASVVAAASRIHQTFNGPVNAAVQRAGLAALQGPTDWLDEIQAEYERRRDLLAEELAGTPGIDFRQTEGTFYSFLRSSLGLSSATLVERALAHGVAVRTGLEFGPAGEGWIRLSFSYSRATLATGLRRLRTAFTELAASAGGAIERETSSVPR